MSGANQGVYLALGANLGNRQANIALALRMLGPLVRVEAVSPLYESAPQGISGEQPPYYNAACRIVTGLSPGLLLRHVKLIEHEIGRRATERWAPRPIDIDIALYNDQVFETPELTLPHPRLTERAFVLRPLVDLDPALVHPATGQRLADLLGKLGVSDLKVVAGVRALR